MLFNWTDNWTCEKKRALIHNGLTRYIYIVKLTLTSNRHWIEISFNSCDFAIDYTYYK